MSEDPCPVPDADEGSLCNDDSVCNMNNLKGERVDPHLRI